MEYLGWNILFIHSRQRYHSTALFRNNVIYKIDAETVNSNNKTKQYVITNMANRFASVDEQQILNIVSEKDSLNTKKATSVAMASLISWPWCSMVYCGVVSKRKKY